MKVEFETFELADGGVVRINPQAVATLTTFKSSSVTRVELLSGASFEVKSSIEAVDRKLSPPIIAGDRK